MIVYAQKLGKVVLKMIVQKMENRIPDDWNCFVPSELITDKSVPPISIRLWLALDYFISNGKNSPALADIAETAMTTVVTARKALDKMEQEGWIKREKDSVTSPIRYIVYAVKFNELPEIEVSHATLANRKNNNLTSPRRSFGRNVR